MKSEYLFKQMEFIKEIDNVKYLRRRTKLFNSHQNENNAEHSWHLAVMAITLSEYAGKEIDLLKVIKMILLHDIGNIEVTSSFSNICDKNYEAAERVIQSYERIFSILPEEKAEEFNQILTEIEEGFSEEAKFVKSLNSFKFFCRIQQKMRGREHNL